MIGMVASFAMFALTLTPSACGLDATAGGKRLSLEVRVLSSKESSGFTNAAGWRIQLSKALAATGPIAFYERPASLAAYRRKAHELGFLSIRSAWAHPGHGADGDAIGELLSPSSVDLLTGGSLGIASALSGTVRSASVSFAAPATGPFANELGAFALVLEGTAERGTELRAFRATIPLDELRGALGRPEILGCTVEGASIASNGVMRLEVKLGQWFDQVDFTDAPRPNPGAVPTLEPGLARNQLIRGIKAAPSYVFSYASP